MMVLPTLLIGDLALAKELAFSEGSKVFSSWPKATRACMPRVATRVQKLAASGLCLALRLPWPHHATQCKRTGGLTQHNLNLLVLNRRRVAR